jgi:ornithine cyclodeaminase
MAIYLSEDDVRHVLTMPVAMAAVESAHRELSASQQPAQDTPRARTRLPQTALHLLHGALPARGVLGFKAYTSNRSGNRFQVQLFDAASGELQAIIAADFLGMMRTGAASGVATRWLARPDAQVLGVFGTGWQAEGHVLAQCAARSWQQIQVFGRDPIRQETFCARLRDLTGADIVSAHSPEAMVREADVVGTITTAASPLFDADWLKAGAHINAAGSNALIRHELSEATVRKCGLVAVDTVATAIAEAGDLLPLLEKGRLQPRQLVELGDVIVGQHPGRRSAEEITLFESQGLAVQDLAVAAEVLALAEARGLGQQLPF